jgi:hypothetical protein
MKLQDLYKLEKNPDGSFNISLEEKERFEENFQDYLEIRYAVRHNTYVNDMYAKLLSYSQWFNKI